MTENIMFIPAVVLMVVEAGVLIFLIGEWIKAKKEEEDGTQDCIQSETSL